MSPPAQITQVEAFRLHSRPGAPKTVYIDLDGHVVTGTIWNSESGFGSHPLRPYDSNGNPSTWSTTELNVVADIWRRMAEDFAPYDIDVTTEQPAVFNSNVGHVVVTYKTDANGNPIFVCNCGGVAYVDVFGTAFAQPALVFVDGVGTGAHNISEAASHEFGHNLGLTHDGTSTVGYYTGHGTAPVDWAPIMGVGYYRNVTQWSKGEYPGANNTQDDLQQINVYLPYRTDDHSDTSLSDATPLVVTGGVNVVAYGRASDPSAANMANKGVIEDRTDIDLFSLDVGTGQIDLSITPGYFETFIASGLRGMNLDIDVLLLDDAGNVLQASNPDLGTDAHISYDVPVAGRYYLEISGVGRGNPLADGYTDYASIGQYYISGTVPPDVAASQAPVAPDDLIALLADDTSIDLDWSDPIATAETNEAGYRVMRSVDGGAFALIASLPRDSAGYSDNNLANGDYVYKLELFNGAGTSETAPTPAISIDAPLVAVATSENTFAGSILSGSYINTQQPAGAEQLLERQSGSRRINRVSSLDHSWTIPGVVPAAVVELYLRASAPANAEGEDFRFSYSINGGSAQQIGTAFSGGTVQEWTVALPNDTAGTVIVRVVDTDRTKGNGVTDTVTIYEMNVTSAGSPADEPPSVSITEPLDGTTINAGTEIVLSATVTDEDANLAPSIAWSSDLQGPLGSSSSIAVTLDEGTHVVTATVTDSAGQPGADSVSVTVLPVDDTPPSITAPADIAAEATGPMTSVALGSPTVSDDSDPSPAITSNAPAQGFPPGSTVVTWTATDASGNQSTDTQTVTVRDTTPPLITVLGDNPASVTAGAAYVDAGATAADLVSGAVSVGTSGQSFSTAAPGNHVVTYTATDAAGNSRQATRTVNVVAATTSLSVTGINPGAIDRYVLLGGVSVTISGTGFTGTPTLTFANGSGSTPIATNVTLVNGQTLSATISTNSAGKRKDRVWDVVVTLPGGASATCAGCLLVTADTVAR